ncbi:MAG: hypothetical protein R2771_09150, partial [Saprospiraceae bacterium]
MKEKLLKFNNYIDSLYPHELDYLMRIHRFEKGINFEILQKVYHNVYNPENRIELDITIDKRSYSYVKKWMENSLLKADVDIFHKWLLDTESLILNDNITPEREKEILNNIRVVEPS